MKVVCIIPARGGSKRIPRKNIRPFLGKPIVAYSIESALSSSLFDEVMVSTDDGEIADTARLYGADVPFYRSLEGADDYAGLADVVFEVLTRYETEGKRWEYFCCLLPTAPLVSADDLIKANNLFVNSDVNAVVPVVRFRHPIQRALKIDGNGYLEMVASEHLTSRSQDLELRYHDAGQYYFEKTDILFQEKRLFPSQTLPIELSEIKVQDIDTYDDWKLAELKYSMLNK